MIKNCYFAVSAADGTAGDEEIACCNAAFYSHMEACLLYTSPSPRDVEESRMPSSA